ncbi:unnamed protein product, partial [marine sediment metagenome]
MKYCLSVSQSCEAGHHLSSAETLLRVEVVAKIVQQGLPVFPTTWSQIKAEFKDSQHRQESDTWQIAKLRPSIS